MMHNNLLKVFTFAFAANMAPLVVGIAALCHDSYTGFQVLMFASTPTFMASGFVWPGSCMPDWLSALMQLIPATPALEALRLTAQKGAARAGVVDPLIHLGALFAFYTALIWVISGFAEPIRRLYLKGGQRLRRWPGNSFSKLARTQCRLETPPPVSSSSSTSPQRLSR